METIIDILKQWGYEPLQVKGKGAFSQVYCVKEVVTGRIYACKVSEKQEMLCRESILLRKIEHPLFPKFHDYRQGKNYSFLFMEYVSGENLKELIAAQGVLSERRAITIAVELAGGLQYLHELNPPVLYRDLKPDNIMVGDSGEIRLLDLGSADISAPSRRVITGTPGFAAPEQWSMDGKVGFYSDVYGLAEVMYYMMTGTGTGNAYESMVRVRIPGQKVHRGVEILLEECLRRDICERIPDMRYFLQRLKPYYLEDKGTIRKLEIAARFAGKRAGEYVFEKNVLLK